MQIFGTDVSYKLSKFTASCVRGQSKASFGISMDTHFLDVMTSNVSNPSAQTSISAVFSQSMAKFFHAEKIYAGGLDFVGEVEKLLKGGTAPPWIRNGVLVLG